MFAKSPRSCIIDPNEPYYIPPGRERTDWEGELAIIIGKPARLVPKESTKDYVFGYSIMYDVSDRGGGTPRRTVSMFPGANWFEGKSVDRGAPFGPVIVPKEFLPNAENLKLTTKVNGEIMQDANTNQLIWKERHLIKYLSDILTLYPGDVIATGTPAGTGAERRKFLKAGRHRRDRDRGHRQAGDADQGALGGAGDASELVRSPSGRGGSQGDRRARATFGLWTIARSSPKRSPSSRRRARSRRSRRKTPNARFTGAPHSIAQIVAHMTFWQELFAARCEGVAEAMPATAASGWPDVAAGSWPAQRDRFLAGLDRVLAAGKTPDRAISPAIEFPPLAHFTIGDALVHIGQHNAHHLGQIILLRQLMGLWPPPSGAYTW